MDTELLKRVREALDELGGELDKRNDTPSTAAAAAAPVASTAVAPAYLDKIITRSEMDELRGELRKKSTPELLTLFGLQARKRNSGIPVDAWMAAGGRTIEDALAQDPFIRKTLDASGATALIRQDLEPVLYELFVRTFPYWDRIAKEPANGLVHAWNQVSDYGDATFMTELGTVTDDVSTYVRKTTPIAVLATRRGLSLKSQFAVLQGGAGYNAEQQELRGGLIAMAHKLQKTIFQGNATDSGGTAANDSGAYDANSFDGLRKTITTNLEDVDLTAGTPDDIRAGIIEAATDVMQEGGATSALYCEPAVAREFDEQQDKNVRIVDTRDRFAAGVNVASVNTPFGDLALQSVIGDSVGEYTPSGKSGTYSDIFLLDEGTISMPYLGAPGIQVLDIPIGISGQLTHLFILFGMWGLAVKAEPFQARVRVKLSSS